MKSLSRPLILLLITLKTFTVSANAQPMPQGTEPAPVLHQTQPHKVVLNPARTEIPYLPFEWSYHQPVYEFDEDENELAPRLMMPARGQKDAPGTDRVLPL